MSVLIFASSDDGHASAVSRDLAYAGVPTRIVDLGLFPQALSLRIEHGHASSRSLLTGPDFDPLDMTEIEAIWWRRPQPFRFPAGMDEAARRFSHYESSMAFDGMYHSLAKRWMNPPAAEEIARQKPYQLNLAREIGFAIPETLITNDPAAARAFCAAYPGEVIHKQFVALPETWRETRRVTNEDLAQFDSVRHAPVLFQRHVEAIAEVRVIVVYRQIFAASVSIDALQYAQDVRMNLDAIYAEFHLPDAVADRVLALMDRLGLIYGAIDLRLSADGTLTFLEINPAGQFLYVERATGLPITATVAAWLAGKPLASN